MACISYIGGYSLTHCICKTEQNDEFVADDFQTKHGSRWEGRPRKFSSAGMYTFLLLLFLLLFVFLKEYFSNRVQK